jgi:hypothetical protein
MTTETAPWTAKHHLESATKFLFMAAFANTKKARIIAYDAAKERIDKAIALITKTP